MSLFAAMSDENSVWSKGSSLFNISSPLNDLLETDSFTLDQILQEDELIQEVKTRNTKLLEFMSQEEVVLQLIHYVVQPSEDMNNDIRTLKYPYMACEVICCDISSITETLACAQDGKIVESLFAFLYTSVPLDPRLAGYFEKIMSMLMVRKPQEMTVLMNKHAEVLLRGFMNHVQSYSVSELLKRLLQPYHNDYADDMMDFPGMSMHGGGGYLSTPSWYGNGMDEDEMSVGTPTSSSTKKTLVWQQDTTVIDLLIANLQSTNGDSDIHKHSADILVDIIHCATRAQSSGELASPTHSSGPTLNGPMVLLDYLETDEILQKLLDLGIPAEGMTVGSSSMISALSVLSALLARHTNVRYVTVDVLPSTIAHIVTRIPQLCATLQADDGMIINQRHQSVPRLGLRRLKLVGLLVLLLQTKYIQVDRVILSEHVIEICLDLFFKYESVNMLHAEMENMVIGILETGGNDVLTALIKQGHLLSRIVTAHEQNEQGCAFGFMGHLHHICYTIIRLIEDVHGDDGTKEQSLHEMTHADTVLEMLEEEKDVWNQWESLVARVLKPMYERECQPLGGEGSKSVNGEDPYTILGNASAIAAMNDKFAEMLSGSQFGVTDDFDVKTSDTIMMPELMQDSSSSSSDDDEPSTTQEEEEEEEFSFDPRGSNVKRWQNVETSDDDNTHWANFEQAANSFASFETSTSVEMTTSFAAFDVQELGVEEAFTADFSQMVEVVVPPAPSAVDTTEEES